MRTPLEKDRDFVGWILVGVSVSASGDFVVLVVVIVAVTSIFPKNLKKKKKSNKKILAFLFMGTLG